MYIVIIGKLSDWTLFTYRNLLGLISRKVEIYQTKKINVLHFEFQCQKFLRLYHNIYICLFCIDLSTKPYQGLWFNQTHPPLFHNMSMKIYTNFFLSSGGFNFKINYLKDKTRHGIWVSCWTIWRQPHCNTSINFGTGDFFVTK